MKRDECLGEVYLFYSSLTLFVMGCLALVVSIFFYLKFHSLKSLPKDISANVFNKSFVVFNPFSEHRKIIHTFVLALPIIGVIISFVLTFVLLKVFEYGFMLSVFIVIVGLNLIAVEGAFEVYQNSKIFIKAVRGGSNFGVGDLKAFQIVKNAIPTLIKYYFGLAILFIILSMALPYIWSSILGSFTTFAGLLLGAGASTGAVGYQIAVMLFALILVVIQILASIVKKRLLRYTVE